MSNIKNCKGVTLAEVLLAAGILVFVLTGLLVLFVNCSFLNETNRNFSTAMTHAQYVMEELRGADTIEVIKQIILNKNYTTQFTESPLLSENISVCSCDPAAGWVCTCSVGSCNICSSNCTLADPLEICVRVDWNDRRGMIRNVELRTAMTDYPGIHNPNKPHLKDCTFTSAQAVSVDCVHDYEEAACCFLSNTKITMADGSLKNIEDIKLGDVIRSFNVQKHKFEDNKVLGLASPMREGYYNLYLEDGQQVRVTNEHPFYTKKTDGSLLWCSLEPKTTHKSYPHLSFVRQLEVGDQVLTDEGNWSRILYFEYKEESVKTYNLSKIENTNNFFANGLLSHNKYGYGVAPPP